jgi:ATP-dependent protease Clp ATPase subunit
MCILPWIAVNRYLIFAAFPFVNARLKCRNRFIPELGDVNILMIFPPGSGKTMLAKRIPTILPPFSLNEALETTKYHTEK